MLDTGTCYNDHWKNVGTLGMPHQNPKDPLFIASEIKTIILQCQFYRFISFIIHSIYRHNITVHTCFIQFRDHRAWSTQRKGSFVSRRAILITYFRAHIVGSNQEQEHS